MRLCFVWFCFSSNVCVLFFCFVQCSSRWLAHNETFLFFKNLRLSPSLLQGLFPVRFNLELYISLNQANILKLVFQANNWNQMITVSQFFLDNFQFVFPVTIISSNKTRLEWWCKRWCCCENWTTTNFNNVITLRNFCITMPKCLFHFKLQCWKRLKLIEENVVFIIYTVFECVYVCVCAATVWCCDKNNLLTK